jgi:Ca2+/H+ antiporter
MEKLLKLISSYDYFGHYVVFSFNKQVDNVHRTAFGGFVSILMNIVMLVYVVFLLIRMITRQYDFNYQYDSAWNNGDDWT